MISASIIICQTCGEIHKPEHYLKWQQTGAMIVGFKFYCCYSCYHLGQPHSTSLWDTTESELYESKVVSLTT